MTHNATSNCQNKKDQKKSWHATIYKTPRKRQTSHALEAILFRFVLIHHALTSIVPHARQFTGKVTFNFRRCVCVRNVSKTTAFCFYCVFCVLLLLFDYGVHGSIKFFLVFCLFFLICSLVWFITLLHECIDFFTFFLLLSNFGLPCTHSYNICFVLFYSNVST